MRRRFLWLRLVCSVLTFGTTVLPLETGTMSPASAETAPTSPILQATEAAGEGKDEEVVRILRPLVAADSISAAERPTALNLLGKSYVHLGSKASGDSMFFRLAVADRTWKPTLKDYSDEELTVAEGAYHRAHPGMVKRLTVWRSPWWKDAKTYVYPAIIGVVVWLATRTTPPPPRTPLPELPPPPTR
jgi:hypothetical protein